MRKKEKRDALALELSAAMEILSAYQNKFRQVVQTHRDEEVRLEIQKAGAEAKVTRLYKEYNSLSK